MYDECLNKAILMSTYNIHFHDKIKKSFHSISLNICFLEITEEFNLQNLLSHMIMLVLGTIHVKLGEKESIMSQSMQDRELSLSG